MNTLYWIGTLSPLILFLITLRVKFSKVYIVFFILNIALNLLLKKIIHQPRPNHTGEDGMPSGHAQEIFFSATYLILLKAPWYIQFISFILVCLTLYQRYIQKFHTISQLFVGAIIGSFMGFIAWKGNSFFSSLARLT